jgi:hypothetical protein
MLQRLSVDDSYHRIKYIEALLVYFRLITLSGLRVEVL